MKTEIELRSGGRAWVAEDGRPTALGLIVSEHVDKIGFFEPTVEVVEKELLPDRIRFVLKQISSCQYGIIFANVLTSGHFQLYMFGNPFTPR